MVSSVGRVGSTFLVTMVFEGGSFGSALSSASEDGVTDVAGLKAFVIKPGNRGNTDDMDGICIAEEALVKEPLAGSASSDDEFVEDVSSRDPDLMKLGISGTFLPVTGIAVFACGIAFCVFSSDLGLETSVICPGALAGSSSIVGAP